VSTDNSSSKPAVVPKHLLLPFIMVTVLFPLWGFANDITNPMVAAFKNILLVTLTLVHISEPTRPY